MQFLDSVNWAHVHLILNHVPVVAIPVAFLFLICGVVLENSGMKQLSLLFLIILSVLTIGVFFTGEPAEDVVEKIPGVVESVIESHEEASKFSLALVVLMGVFSIHAYQRELRGIHTNGLSKVVILLALLTSLSLGYTANLGGKIRHTEIIQEK